MEPLKGKSAGTSDLDPVYTRQQRIAELAGMAPQMALPTLAQHIDLDWLKEAYRRTRKDGAVGVDEQTARDYAEHLEGNLRSLLERAKSGTYHAPPVRRVHIPKGDGQTRPIGIPTFEDKVLQRAVIAFRQPRCGKHRDGDAPGSGTFDLLGFTHYWGKSRHGHGVVKRKTAGVRLSRALQRIGVWCRSSGRLHLRSCWGITVTTGSPRTCVVCRCSVAGPSESGADGWTAARRRRG